MTQLETIAVLMNGGHVEWQQSLKPGPSYYRVILPSYSADKSVGFLTDRMAADMFDAGFLIVVDHGDWDDDGVRHTILKLGKGSLDFLKDKPQKRISKRR